MSIASASKWFYSTYFVQRTRRCAQRQRHQVLQLPERLHQLRLLLPLPGQTVQECLDYGSNGVYTAADDGKFSYGGGHMEKHAALNGLGTLNNATLADEIRSQVGNEIAFTYSSSRSSPAAWP